MGGSESKETEGAKAEVGVVGEEQRWPARVAEAFQRLSEGRGTLAQPDVEGLCDGWLGELLYRAMRRKEGTDKPIGLDAFAAVTQGFLRESASAEPVLRLLPSPAQTDDLVRLLEESLAADGIPPPQPSHPAIVRLAHHVLPEPAPVRALEDALALACPDVLNHLFRRIQTLLFPQERAVLNYPHPGSQILDPVEMWLVRKGISVTYKPVVENSATPIGWRCLFDSSADGLSGARFQDKVLGYKGPTVTVLQLLSGEVVAFGVDEEWRLGPGHFGQSDCFFLRVQPELELPATVLGKGSLGYHPKGRGAAAQLGVWLKAGLGLLETAADLSGVSAAEVWGCGSEADARTQADLKAWEARQVDKAKKVPLPGHWDQNPDKVLMDMAGLSSAASYGVFREVSQEGHTDAPLAPQLTGATAHGATFT